MAEDREAQIQAALAEADQKIKPNYAAIADKYGIHRSTLSRRHRLKTRDPRTFRSESKQLLSDAEEAILVDYLNHLASYGLFATTRILINIVEERLGREISHNWPSGFVARHKDKLKSIYLKGFDRSRFASESVANLTVFFENVSQIDVFKASRLII
jgi:hypothetical protein